MNKLRGVKYLVIFLSALLLLPFVSAEPIYLCTAEDFQQVRDNLGGDFVLNCDINLEGVDFEPIGSEEEPFTGKFNGKNHIISNFEHDGYDFTGFFARASGATIRNLKLENVNVTGRVNTGGLVGHTQFGTKVKNVHVTGKVTGEQYGRWTGGVIGHIHVDSIVRDSSFTGEVTGNSKVGGLAGTLHGSTLTNSHANAIVRTPIYGGALVGYLQFDQFDGTPTIIEDSYASGDVEGGLYQGGLVGWSDKNSIIRKSRSDAEVRTGQYAGGLIGRADATPDMPIIIEDSHASGKVSATSYSIGGLAGHVENAIITGSGATGDVISLAEPEAQAYNFGGLIGMAVNTEITRSWATGYVRGIRLCGGLVGSFTGGTVSESFSESDVDCDGDILAYSGGLIGRTLGQEDSLFENLYATGKVSSNSGVGGAFGFVGHYQNNLIRNVYSTGLVDNQHRYAGGLVGEEYNGVVEESYWDVETSGQENSDGGTGKTTEEMTRQTTFEGWDFEETWGIEEGKGYPYLKKVTPKVSAAQDD